MGLINGFNFTPYLIRECSEYAQTTDVSKNYLDFL